MNLFLVVLLFYTNCLLNCIGYFFKVVRHHVVLVVVLAVFLFIFCPHHHEMETKFDSKEDDGKTINI